MYLEKENVKKICLWMGWGDSIAEVRQPQKKTGSDGVSSESKHITERKESQREEKARIRKEKTSASQNLAYHHFWENSNLGSMRKIH